MQSSKVNRDNFIVIQGWMLTDLKLKGNELLVYACIYGFSQAENQVFSGSLQYLADWTNSTKQGVMKNLKSLEKKGYIVKNEKYINGVKFCEYYATKFNTSLNNVEGGMQQSLTGGMQQSLPNNISLNNTINNIADKKERKKESTYEALVNELIIDEKVKVTVYEFIKMRKLIKKPMTDFALKKMLNKLLKISIDPSIQIAVLEKSIMNNWQDIYEPKEYKAPANKKSSIMDEYRTLQDKIDNGGLFGNDTVNY